MPLLNAVIDISHFQNVSSFQEVRENGIVGVIHKATEGTAFVDARYDARRPRALAAGLLWGAYHFGVRGNAQRQADHFLNIVQPGPTDLLVLDFEPNPREGTMTVADAETFVNRIANRTGRFPGLYSGQAFLREQLGNRRNAVLANCFLWIARYAEAQPVVQATWPRFTLWQYTDGNVGPQPHQVNGIGRCDRDKFNGDEAGLRRLWGVPAPVPPPAPGNV